MSEIIKFSIIIPVYNVEQYIGECVRSVQNQSYSNIEIILVDDGSKDNSLEVCDSFSILDNRIKVVHKKNGGLSDARNEGMKLVTGDYVTFLDGDDFWDDRHALEKISKRILKTKAEVTNFLLKKYYEDTGEMKLSIVNVKDMPLSLSGKKEQIQYLTDRGLYIASACNKVIRSDLAKNLPFERGIYSEDIEWCARLLLNAKSMDFISDGFYCYRQRESSISHAISMQKCNDLKNNIFKCIRLLDVCDKDTKEALKYFSAYQYATFFKIQAQCDKIPVDCIKQLAKYKWILRNNHTKKVLILYVTSSFLGYANTCKLIRKLYRKRGKRKWLH